MNQFKQLVKSQQPMKMYKVPKTNKSQWQHRVVVFSGSVQWYCAWGVCLFVLCNLPFEWCVIQFLKYFYDEANLTGWIKSEVS